VPATLRSRRERRQTTGVTIRVLALIRAFRLTGLLVAGAVLLAVAVAPLVLTGLGFGHLIKDLGQTSQTGFSDLVRGSFSGTNAKYLTAGLAGLAGCWILLPMTLLAVRRYAVLTRRLSERWCGVPIGAAYAPRPAGTHPGRWPGTTRLRYRQWVTWLLTDVATWRDLGWLAVNVVIGWVFLLVPLTLVGTGLVGFVYPALETLPRPAVPNHLVPPPAFPGNTPPVLFLIGLAMTVAGVWAAPPLLRGYGLLARLVLAPSDRIELERRVAHLAQTRRETLDTGAAELRRIERDLHDGAQARLVAMGLTLDAAGRLIDTDPAAARALLYEARDASARALSELRDLVRGIHPPVLADRGLADAVRALALDTPLRVTVTGTLPGRVPAPVESAAYFAVSELLTNVAKHAEPACAEVDLRYHDGALRIMVRDDGDGGADPARGSGLRGIARRVAAFDGVLVISSPAGGPTVVSMEVPCALAAPRSLEVPCALS
jgi:signal transduction histidine kinase